MRLPLLVSAALVAATLPLAASSSAAVSPCQPWTVKDLA
ncbi:MAG: hypothetical protein JWN31_526, partial [Frankiales bacterium]|nr:hypothetical protein [Frankiales bacterium]